MIPYFKNKDPTFLAHLLPMLEPQKINKGEFIYKKDEYPNYIYFIVTGRVNFVIGPNDLCFKAFVSGSYFGDIEIFK